MKKKLFAVGLAGVLAGCGGGGVLEGGVPVFETSVLVVEPERALVVSDVLSRSVESQDVRAGNNCTTLTRANDVCTKVEYDDDLVRFRFSVRQTTETQLPSPVKVEGYRVSYSACTTDTMSAPLSMVVNPGETKETDLVVAFSTTKRNMAQTEIYVYTSQDGCQTTFTRPAYAGECRATARIDFSIVEVFTGKRRTVPVYVDVVFKDVPGQNECR